MSDSTTPPATPPSPNSARRRSSFAGATFSELFGRSGNKGATTGSPAAPSSTANAQTNRRSMSITTLGLSGSPISNSPFGKFTRRASMSSSAGSGDPNFEEAVMEENENASPNNAPTSPFARRVSFGAQALRDVRSGSGSAGNGRNPSSHLASSPPSTPSSGRGLSSASTTSNTSSTKDPNNPKNVPTNSPWRQIGEGFNWSEALRTRAERAPSIGGLGITSPSTGNAQPSQPQRANTAPTPPPPKEMPKPSNAPDPVGERILRGQFFHMD